MVFTSLVETTIIGGVFRLSFNINEYDKLGVVKLLLLYKSRFEVLLFAKLSVISRKLKWTAGTGFAAKNKWTMGTGFAVQNKWTMGTWFVVQINGLLTSFPGVYKQNLEL